MGFSKRTIRDVPLDNHTVLVRTDYDIPLDAKNMISNDSRIKSSLPTLRHLLDRGCKVVIISHLGCPNSRDQRYSLEPVALKLAQLLGLDVRFVRETVGDRVFQAIKRAPKNSIIVLENLRFHAGEEANDSDFAMKLAKSTGARYFVQEGCGIVWQSHASTDTITMFIPSVAGLLLERDYKTILRATELPGIKNLLDSRT